MRNCGMRRLRMHQTNADLRQAASAITHSACHYTQRTPTMEASPTFALESTTRPSTLDSHGRSRPRQVLFVARATTTTTATTTSSSRPMPTCSPPRSAAASEAIEAARMRRSTSTKSIATPTGSDSDEILENWVRDFRSFRFQVKHLLIATAVLAIVLTLWPSWICFGTAVVLLVMISVAGAVFLSCSGRRRRPQDEADRRRQEMYARRRAQFEKTTGAQRRCRQHVDVDEPMPQSVAEPLPSDSRPGVAGSRGAAIVPLPILAGAS